jgi:ABC-2 type transport system ATP-binding protein
MSVMEVSHVTKDYGRGRGVFDLSFGVDEGEVLGFLGPNGAGKTTTIRQLMGFIRPDRGALQIRGKDCFKERDEIQRSLGYLPGEIAFINSMKGMEFIQFVARMKDMKGTGRAAGLMERFELQPDGKISRMSKGMKQKIGIVCAFMDDPQILILDEPTSGLDPLMQNRFTELILEEQKRGKTILMSSHMFEEVERTCKRAVIIKSGKLVAVEDVEKLRDGKGKKIEVRFADEARAAAFVGEYTLSGHGKAWRQGAVVCLQVQGSMDAFLKMVSKYPVLDLQTQGQSLEELFMHFYGESESGKSGKDGKGGEDGKDGSGDNHGGVVRGKGAHVG